MHSSCGDFLNFILEKKKKKPNTSKRLDLIARIKTYKNPKVKTKNKRFGFSVWFFIRVMSLGARLLCVLMLRPTKTNRSARRSLDPPNTRHLSGS